MIQRRKCFGWCRKYIRLQKENKISHKHLEHGGAHQSFNDGTVVTYNEHTCIVYMLDVCWCLQQATSSELPKEGEGNIFCLSPFSK